MADDDNSFISALYQIGPKNLKNYCMGKILKQFVDPKTYDYLRSRYQLGYAVGCSLDQTGEILSFYLVVLSQEHKHRFNAVQMKIDDFIDNTITTAIDELSDEEFEKFRSALIKELQAEILTLDTEVSYNYSEISEEFYLFDRRDLMVEVTKNITKSDFQEFFHSFIDHDKQRVLCTHVIGNEKRAVDVDENNNNNSSNSDAINIEFINERFTDERVVDNIQEFQQDLYLYPAVKSHVL